jgi:Fe-S-cluster-containing hydrogenase component 2
LEHYGYHAPHKSRIHVEASWPDAPDFGVCIGCAKKKCVAICPHGALKWDGWVQVDTDLCDSCGLCVEACPTSGIRLAGKNKTPLICDTCQGKFLCVQWCPTQAVEKRNI